MPTASYLQLEAERLQLEHIRSDVIARHAVLDAEPEQMIQTRDRLLRFYDSRIADIRKKQSALLSAVQSIPDKNASLVLYKNLIQGIRLEAVADQMGYSLSSVNRLKREGLEHIRHKITKGNT